MDSLFEKYLDEPSADKADSKTISDPLLNKYKIEEQISKTPSKEFWKDLANDPTLMGSAKRLGVGALRGGKDILDTAAEGLASGTAYVANKILPEKLSSAIQKNVDETYAADKIARNEFDKQYPSAEGIVPTATDVGRVGGQIAATLPVMPVRVMSGIAAAAKATPTILATGEKIAAPILNRVGASVGQGAVGGAVLGAATSSTNDKTLAENVGEGAITGAIGGPLLTGATAAGKTLGGKVVGKISSSTAELAKRAEELGIPLKASQVSNSPLMKKFDQMSGMLPFSGAQGITEHQLAKFTQAVSKTFGENVSEITPQIVADARKKIGSEIEGVGARATIKVDKQLVDDLRTVLSDANATHAESELRPIQEQVKNVISKISPAGEINGDAYLALTNYKAVLSKAQNSSNPNIRNSANEIRNAIDEALTRNISGDEKAALLKARAKYKAVMTIKDLVDASAEGHVSPLKLMGKINKAPGGKLRSGELGELADIGRKFFPTPADSGTPLGEMVLGGLTRALHSPLSTLPTATGALLSGASLADLAAGGVGLGINRAIRSAVNSNPVRKAIIRSGTGETHGYINSLTEGAVPYSSAFSPKKEKARITYIAPLALEK